MPRAGWLTPQAMVAHADAWRSLAARALEPNLFCDPAFALPAALHLPTGRQPAFLLAWADDDPGRLIGVCCVAPPVPGFPLRAWLHPQATAAFPLLDAEHARHALVDLLAQTRSRIRIGGLLLSGLPAEGATARLLDTEGEWSAAPLERRTRAVLRHTWVPPGGKAGKEFRRQARRLAEQGAVSLVSAEDPPAVAAALDDFLALEALGWKGRHGTALALAPERAAFVTAMISALAAEGRCRIDRLESDGRPIAAGIILRSGTTAYFWKTAYDEAFARFSPGVHLAAAIGARQSRDPGISLTDSCAIPGHGMIDPLWPDRIAVVDVAVGLPGRSRPAFQAARRAEIWRRALRRAAKRLWQRRPGLT